MPTVSGVLRQLAQEGKLVVARGGTANEAQDPEELLQALTEPDLRKAVVVEQSDGSEEVRLVENGIILTDGQPLFRLIEACNE